MNMEAARFSEKSLTSYEPERRQHTKDYYAIIRW